MARRMSSLPTLQFCGKSDTLGKDVETINAFRSTCFHKFCETGEWPKEVARLPTEDFEEIKRWYRPKAINHPEAGYLVYKDAVKEKVLALDKDFNFIELPDDISQKDINERPEIMASGHLDMAWDIPENDLVVIVDIKSSIFAVKDKAESLQLHAYGLAYAIKLGRKRYIPGIWDASDAKYYFGKPVDLESFEVEVIKANILQACNNSDQVFTKGTHCSGCWKRDNCPAHFINATDETPFVKLFNGTANEEDIRAALVQLKAMGDLTNKVSEICKSWTGRHGPVRSEDGSREWVGQLRSGKKSLSKDALCEALKVDNLDSFMKQSDDYFAFDWRLVKDRSK